ncbi:TIGR03943 family putative permease subunit [Streptomyces sp. NPDC057877]|uniref:TIGR03943 family putative permease subunit n=1 Tax=Streptomyces sp. NPDC057877 TaxID=3346269 RepID=UPI00368F4819
MNRHAQAAVLFLLGAAVVHAAATDLALRYVKDGLRPLLLASGVVLVAAAVATVWYEHRGGATQEGDGGQEGQEGHENHVGQEGHENHVGQEGHENHVGQEGHEDHSPRVAWLLTLPLLTLILIAPPALGSYSATHTGTALQEPHGYATLPDGDPVRLGLTDYAGRAAYDHGRTLRGRTVKVTGFVALDGEGTPYLVRMTLNCCAADARPVKVGLTGRVPPVLQPDTWLRVTGTYSAQRAEDPVNEGPIPFLRVARAEPIPEPEQPYDDSGGD